MATTKHVARPDHVFVGNHTFRIEWLTHEEWDARHLDDNADASTWATQQLIAMRIRGEAAESHYQEILVHELLHAVWDSTMLTHVAKDDLPNDHEEFIIQATAPGLFFVMKQNPHVMHWLLNADGTEVRS